MSYEETLASLEEKAALSGLNGLKRDKAKLKLRMEPYKIEMAPHISRFKKKPLPHEFTNLCTESSRADPYVNGHIMSISYYVLGLIIVGLIAALVIL